MAQVMEAVASGHGGFERRVAIKRLLPQHARDGERRRMFFEEARIGSRMHHGGIVPILDYGLIDGSEFMAMEYVEGLDALRAVSSCASSSFTSVSAFSSVNLSPAPVETSSRF